MINSSKHSNMEEDAPRKGRGVDLGKTYCKGIVESKKIWKDGGEKETEGNRKENEC